MLKIIVEPKEGWDEKNQIFVSNKRTVLQLEHSLVSLSKWESKWHKPFLDNKAKTEEEIIDYIRCMTITQNVDSNIYYSLSEQNLIDINNYIENPMSATTIKEQKTGKLNGELVTSELIYYWMVALQIPFECQRWHLNRLITLIRICNIKNQPPKKMSRSKLMANNTAINKARRAKLGHHG